MNSYDSFEEMPIRHCLSLLAHRTHGLDSCKRRPHLRLILFAAERQHDLDIAGIKGLPRRGPSSESQCGGMTSPLSGESSWRCAVPPEVVLRPRLGCVALSRGTPLQQQDGTTGAI
jgi:hypothetical protein